MTKIGRNALCPCGSGKKYKKCCLGKEEPLGSVTESDVPARPTGASPFNLAAPGSPVEMSAYVVAKLFEESEQGFFAQTARNLQ
ncbi:MAG: SEC-C metal-binding domain-containing protein [Thiohalocapsa sp.]